MPRYSLKLLLLIIAAIACGLAFVRAAYIQLTHFETAENVARVAWLPNSASNVSYFGRFTKSPATVETIPSVPPRRQGAGRAW